MALIKTIFKWIFAVAFVLAGANHFVNPGFYTRIMPPVLPAPLLLVYLSGAIEIALAALLLIPKYSRYAAFGLIALLVAVFPANIYMALYPERFPEFSRAALIARLPLQLVLIAWAFWLSRDKINS
jgi:uncharacterized membrane protein